MSSWHGDDNVVDYSGNGGWDGTLPAEDPSASRLGTLQNAATSGIGGAIIGGLLNGKKGAITGGLIGAGLGILTGGQDPLSKIAGSVGSVLFGTGGAGADTPSDTDKKDDWRVRISMASGTAGLFYAPPSNGPMSPLHSTEGLVFPTTPTVTVTHQANYSQTNLTHNNYKSYFYQSSDVPAISINGELTAQTVEEAQYVNAAIHFLRACTKMFFGTSAYAGNPPPMVFLNGYGGTYLPNIPCVITNFNHTMPQDVDYIRVPASPNVFWMPTTSMFNVTLQPIYSRQKQLQFGNDQFNSGGYYANGGPNGGFI